MRYFCRKTEWFEWKKGGFWGVFAHFFWYFSGFSGGKNGFWRWYWSKKEEKFRCFGRDISTIWPRYLCQVTEISRWSRRDISTYYVEISPSARRDISTTSWRYLKRGPILTKNRQKKAAIISNRRPIPQGSMLWQNGLWHPEASAVGDGRTHHRALLYLSLRNICAGHPTIFCFRNLQKLYYDRFVEFYRSDLLLLSLESCKLWHSRENKKT